jgi:general secretion pathway protein D
MKIFLTLAAMFFSSLSFCVTLDEPLNGGVLSSASKPTVPRPTIASDGKFSLAMDKIPVSQIVMLFYDQCEKRGIVFDPILNGLDTTLTLKTPLLSCSETKRVLIDALGRAGVVLETRGGYDVAVQSPKHDETEGWQEFIYKPRFRDALELAQFSTIAIRKGRFAHQRLGAAIQQTGSSSTQTTVADTGSNGASLTGKRIDKLVFFGPAIEVKALQSLLSRLDLAVPQVEIRAGIYEFQKGASEANAVTAAMKIFSEKFGVSVNSGAASSVGGTLKISTGNIDAALSLLDSDSRFQYVSQPKVTVRDGEQVSFTSGQDVRVDGSVTLTSSGQSVASKTTLTAGVSLQATPFIRGDVVDVSLDQQVSDFVTSPNNDPSVMRRQLTTKLSMQKGFVYVIGGLKTNRSTTVKQSFFGIPIGSSRDKSDTEVLLLLTVQPEQLDGL